MRLIEIEQKLKSLIEADINDPQVFMTTWDLAYYYLRRKKLLNTETEARDVSYDMASDLYMKILNGKKIHSWLGYISCSVMGYIKYYKWKNRSEIIDATGNSDLAESVVRMTSSSSTDFSNDFKSVGDRFYLEDLPKVIESVMNRSRYYPDSIEWKDTAISIMLTMISGRYINFHLSESEFMYMRMIYASLKDEIIKDISGHSNSSDLSLLQLFSLESVGVESDG